MEQRLILPVGYVRGVTAEAPEQRIYLQHDYEDETPTEALINMRVAATLERHYPGHTWYVSFKETAGVIYIKHPSISRHSGYAINIVNCTKARDLDRAVMRAGGEILERASVKRGLADDLQLAQLNKLSHIRRG